MGRLQGLVKKTSGEKKLVGPFVPGYFYFMEDEQHFIRLCDNKMKTIRFLPADHSWLKFYIPKDKEAPNKRLHSVLI